MSNEEGANVNGGVGFYGLLTIVLITLKLAKVIEISWWVIAGLYLVPFVLGILALVLALGLLAVLKLYEIYEERAKAKRRAKRTN